MTSLADLLLSSPLTEGMNDLDRMTLRQKLDNLDLLTANSQTWEKNTNQGSRWFAQYNVYVDWDADGDYDDAYEDISDRFSAAIIRRGLPGPDAFSAIPAVIEMEFTDTDRFLASDNLDSPLNPFINSVSKKRCKLEANVDGTVYQLFDGWVKEVSSNPESHGRRVATIVAGDLVDRLRYIPMISTMVLDVEEIVLIAQALAGVIPSYYGRATYGSSFYGSSGAASDLETVYASSLDEFAYGGDLWRESDTAALDAIGDVCRSCLGYFYVTRDGVPHFQNRQHRPLNADTADWDASEYARIEAVGVQDESLFNEVMVLIQQRTQQAVGVVWTLHEQPTLSAGASKTYTAAFTDPSTGAACGVLNGLQPVRGTDYTNNTGFRVQVSWRGSDATVTVTNVTAGSILLNLLQLRGTPITRYDVIQLSEGSGVLPRKTHWHDAPALTGTLSAQSYVEWLFTVMSYLTDKPRQATITPLSEVSLAEMCQLDVDRRVILRNDEVSFVNWVQHDIGPGYHTCKIGVSPGIITDMWTLGTSELGIDNALGV